MVALLRPPFLRPIPSQALRTPPPHQPPPHQRGGVRGGGMMAVPAIPPPPLGQRVGGEWDGRHGHPMDGLSWPPSGSTAPMGIYNLYNICTKVLQIYLSILFYF